MCNQNSQLDEQRMLYVYQGLNVVMKLLSQYMDMQSMSNTPVDNSFTQKLANADVSEVIAFAYQAMKNGKLKRSQYEEIFDIAMGTSTVKTTATTVPNGNQWNQEYLAANKFLNQFR